VPDDPPFSSPCSRSPSPDSGTDPRPSARKVGEVGLYLSRQGTVISWEVPGFLAMLGATASLPVLRQKLRWFLGTCRKQTKDIPGA
jgi:hypothetical protein